MKTATHKGNARTSAHKTLLQEAGLNIAIDALAFFIFVLVLYTSHIDTSGWSGLITFPAALIVLAILTGNAVAFLILAMRSPLVSRRVIYFVGLLITLLPLIFTITYI